MYISLILILYIRYYTIIVLVSALVSVSVSVVVLIEATSHTTANIHTKKYHTETMLGQSPWGLPLN